MIWRGKEEGDFPFRTLLTNKSKGSLVEIRSEFKSSKASLYEFDNFQFKK